MHTQRPCPAIIGVRVLLCSRCGSTVHRWLAALLTTNGSYVLLRSPADQSPCEHTLILDPHFNRLLDWPSQQHPTAWTTALPGFGVNSSAGK